MTPHGTPISGPTLHLAIATITSQPGQVEANLGQIEAAAQQAARDDAELLLTPEMSASGYGPYDEVFAVAEVAGEGPIFRTLRRIAQQTGVVVCAGFAETNGTRRHIAHYIVFPDGHFLVQRKYRVSPAEAPFAPYGAFNEDAPDFAALELPIFEVKGARCSLLICADAGFKGINEWLQRNGVQVLLLPTGAGGKREDRVTNAELQTPEGREKYQLWLERAFLPGRAPLECLEFRRALAAVNLGAGDGRDFFHLGHGSIVSAWGEVVGLIPGQPNLDRQQMQYTHAIVGVDEGPGLGHN